MDSVGRGPPTQELPRTSGLLVSNNAATRVPTAFPPSHAHSASPSARRGVTDPGAHRKWGDNRLERWSSQSQICALPLRRAEGLFPGSKSSLPRRSLVGPNQGSPPRVGSLYMYYLEFFWKDLSSLLTFHLLSHYEFMYAHVLLWVIIPYHVTLWLRLLQLGPSRSSVRLVQESL